MSYARERMESTRGQLLIAGPSLLDSNFFRAVVLMIEHSDDGALGLVLNRPSQTTVGEAVAELEQLLDLDDPLFIGGPVQPSSLIVLAEFEDAGDAALIAFDDVGVLATGAALESPRACAAAARSSATPAGDRASSTRRSNAATGSSSRRCARTRSPTSRPTSGRSVLTRKGGDYRLVARMPTDPSMN